MLRGGFRLGADDFLSKPFRKNTLLGAIKAALSRRARAWSQSNSTLIGVSPQTREVNRLISELAEATDGTARYSSARVNNDGSFTLTDLENINYDIIIRGPNFKENKTEDVKPGTNNMSITLQVNMEIIFASDLLPSSFSPSTSTMMSFSTIPALSAGDPGMTAKSSKVSGYLLFSK